MLRVLPQSHPPLTEVRGYLLDYDTVQFQATDAYNVSLGITVQLQREYSDETPDQVYMTATNDDNPIITTGLAVPTNHLWDANTFWYHVGRVVGACQCQASERRRR